ncbi:MAG TPA: dihydrolipoamide acetyltransferase family protein [Solirubrobacterales bacterium]|nr:dihydrolipoamide acetyltransferase family protein [Solirubrobacterales bacterium]
MSSSPTEGAAASSPAASGATGSLEVVMPQMGVSVAEGTIVEWRKRPGDWVAADEPVCDVTTDKVDVEIPAPASGRLERILVEPGATVAVGTALAVIDAGARPGEAHPDEHNGQPAPDQGGGSPATEPSTADGRTDRSGFYSPVVRRIAAKHGINLARVKGTGIGGRVRKKDVLAHLAQGGGPAVSQEPMLHIESPYRPEHATAPAGSGSPGPGAPPSETATGLAGAVRREPMSSMRQAIARHMVESRRTAAHCTTIVEADFSRVAAARGELRKPMARRGVNLTYLAFVACATVEALSGHPRLNASVEGDELVYHEEVNLGIAVALEDGLIVPVIRRAQRLSLEGMAAAIGELARRARERRLEPDDVHGGTFTITNPGQFGAVLATPIINQPQVAILDLEAIVKRPAVVEGPAGDAIAIRPMTYLCMSWDHRALDGADAARFLGAVKDRLERWEVRQ